MCNESILPTTGAGHALVCRIRLIFQLLNQAIKILRSYQLEIFILSKWELRKLNFSDTNPLQNKF